MLRRIYLSPFSRIISAVLNGFAALHKPFMAYGYRDKVSGKFRKRTRISSTALISDRKRVAIADNVWIWHHSIIDGSNGVTIEEGAQIGGWVGIFSHGSQVAVRLLGSSFIEIPRDERPGYTRGSVHIGAYSFVGAGAMILPGTVLGRGSLVSAGAVVSGKFEDFSLLKGNPARRVGDVRSLDVRYLKDEAIQQSYFDPATVAALRDGSLADALTRTDR